MKRTFALGLALLFSALATPAAAEAPAAWTKYCTKCHGDDGVGKTKMGEKLKVSDMTTAEWQDKRKDADLKKMTRAGNPEVKQPAFGPEKVSDADLDALVKYIRALRKK